MVGATDVENLNLTPLLDLLVLVNWAWLLAGLVGLLYAIRSLSRRQRAEDDRQMFAASEGTATAAVHNEVLRIISVYRLRKGRLLVAALALNVFVGMVAVIMVPPVRPQVTLYFLLTAGAMLTSGVLIASVAVLIDRMDVAVERYLAAHRVAEPEAA
jgi:hypothetical protein